MTLRLLKSSPAAPAPRPPKDPQAHLAPWLRDPKPTHGAPIDPEDPIGFFRGLVLAVVFGVLLYATILVWGAL